MMELQPIQQRIATVRGLLEKAKPQIQMALPRGYLTVDRMTRIAMTSIQRTPRLLECDPVSLVGAVIQSAQLGLEPDGVLGQAYLIPYKQKVQFQPGYKGLLVLARRSGEISAVEARVVHAKDHFVYEFGLKPVLEHKPTTAEDRGDVTFVYVIVRLKDGAVQWDVMTAAEIEQHRRQYSRAADDGPWVTAWEEMAKKTVLIRVLKLSPASIELQRAVALEEHAQAGIPQDLDTLLVMPSAAPAAETPKPASALDRLSDKLETEPPVAPAQPETEPLAATPEPDPLPEEPTPEAAIRAELLQEIATICKSLGLKAGQIASVAGRYAGLANYREASTDGLVVLRDYLKQQARKGR